MLAVTCAMAARGAEEEEDSCCLGDGPRCVQKKLLLTSRHLLAHSAPARTKQLAPVRTAATETAGVLETARSEQKIADGVSL